MILFLIIVICSWQISYAMKIEELHSTKKQHCTCNKDPQSLHEASLKLCTYHCEFFLQKGDNPNLLTEYTIQSSRMATTPFHDPIFDCNKDIVQLLFDYNAQVNIIEKNNTNDHYTALFLAAVAKKKFFVWFLKKLKNKYDEFCKEHGKNDILPFFANNIPTTKFYTTIRHELTKRKDAFGRTAHSIMKKKNKKVLEEFLSNK